MILRVLWNDAASRNDTLWKLELKNFVESEYLVDSVGWLVATTELSLAISQDFHRDDGSVRRTLRVPKEYVREIEHLGGDDEEALAEWMKPFLEKKPEAEAG